MANVLEAIGYLIRSSQAGRGGCYTFIHGTNCKLKGISDAPTARLSVNWFGGPQSCVGGTEAAWQRAGEIRIVRFTNGKAGENEVAISAISSEERAAGSPRSRSAVLRMQIVGGNRNPGIESLDQSSATNNYFIGNDPQKWRSNVSQFGKVQYRNIYPGVDLVFYGNHRQLEYDFKVAAGADARRIRLKFKGARRLHVDESQYVGTLR